MPSRTAAPSSSSMSRVTRLVPEVDAAAFVLSGRAAAAVTSGLGDSRAPIGDGDAVDEAAGESDGAGMTVTTADGDARRDRLGDGEGLGLGLGLGAADRVGDGSGGVIPGGGLGGAGPPGPARGGFGAGLGL